MPEGRKEKDEDAQGNEQKDDSSGKVKEFFLDNPTLVLSLLYLYASAIGMGYSAVLYGRFGINIIDYSEISDFLLAAFKNPTFFLLEAVLVFALPFSLVVSWWQVKFFLKLLRFRELIIDLVFFSLKGGSEDSEEKRAQRARAMTVARQWTRAVEEHWILRAALATAIGLVVILLGTFLTFAAAEDMASS